MRFEKRVPFLLVLLFSFGISAQERAPQLDPQSAAYRAERQKASDLFEQGKRLEALPLLEDLVRSNPKDDQMLVALAASLVDHAAMLSDQEAAGKERLRARDLLDQAWRLGNTSNLAQNLGHLLKEMPPSGNISFSENPEVNQIMQAGEAAFARRDFDEAIKNYSHALELEPRNYSAALFIGNAYDRKNDFAKGRDWYQRTMAIDPNTETAYRYCADMLAKQGDMAGARAMLIQAAVAEPYNRMVWRELHAWASINKTQIREVYIGEPVPQSTRTPDGQTVIGTSPPWQAYHSVRNEWQKGDAFKKHYPQETAYRHSLAEEYEALNAAAKTAAAESKDALRKSDKDHGRGANDSAMDLLLRLYSAGLIEPYVLFSLGDDGIARDYAAYRAKHREKLEEYMNKFVVP